MNRFKYKLLPILLLLFSLGSTGVTTLCARTLTTFAYDVFSTYKEYSSPCLSSGRNGYEYDIQMINQKCIISAEEMLETCRQFIDCMYKLRGESPSEYFQKVCVSKTTKALLLGDGHGSGHAVCRTVLDWYQKGYIDDYWHLKEGFHVLCPGDLADRGRLGTEVWFVFMMLKIHNPEQVFVVKGNHETEEIAAQYGFFGPFGELQKRYGEENGRLIEEEMKKAFFSLPIMVLWGYKDHYYMVVHGGLPVHNFEFVLQEETRNLLNETRSRLSVLRKKKVRISTMFVNHPGVNTIYWNDFCRGNQISENSQRGEGLFEIGIGAVTKEVLESYGVIAILCGHKHYDSAITGRTEEGEQKLRETVPVSQYPVYTFMLCPEGQGLNYEGYGLLDNLNLNITPFERNLLKQIPREGYVHVNSSEDGLDFIWDGSRPQSKRSFLAAFKPRRKSVSPQRFHEKKRLMYSIANKVMAILNETFLHDEDHRMQVILNLTSFTRTFVFSCGEIIDLERAEEILLSHLEENFEQISDGFMLAQTIFNFLDKFVSNSENRSILSTMVEQFVHDVQEKQFVIFSNPVSSSQRLSSSQRNKVRELIANEMMFFFKLADESRALELMSDILLFIPQCESINLEAAQAFFQTFERGERASIMQVFDLTQEIFEFLEQFSFDRGTLYNKIAAFIKVIKEKGLIEFDQPEYV